MTMDITGLLADYRAGRRDPSQVAADVLAACAADPGPTWIARVDDAELLARAHALDGGDRSLPLFGVPFAVKDNIDVAGLPTTAGLPGARRVARQTAPVVQRLLDAGALLVGKTNMDQLATGLVGTRSPFGAPSSVADAGRVSGGSSSGSAVAVARGLVAFALGTDTAGSGRVPAAFNGIVGLKPTRGLLSSRGVVPACASLDCVSIFAAEAADAAAVLAVAAAPDREDPWSRAATPSTRPRRGTLGVPRRDALHFTEAPAAAAWDAAVARAGEHFALAEVDVRPLLDAAPLLYDAWVAERTTDLLALVDGPAGRDGLDPTVAGIVRGGAARTAVDVFTAQHALAALRLAAAPIWETCDALLLPTTPGHPTHAEVGADPVGVNSELGRYTNFVNLMDLCAVSVPGPPRGDGLPAGVTVLAPALEDARVLEVGAVLTGAPATPDAFPRPGTVPLVVVGAHMGGLPLNAQLTERGGRFVRAARTAPVYRLYALAGGGPVARTGLVRVPDGGAAITCEVWELAPTALGELLGLIPAPLGLGRVQLEDGALVTGFICEGHAIAGATDVTGHGGWRAYLKAGVPA